MYFSLFFHTLHILYYVWIKYNLECDIQDLVFFFFMKFWRNQVGMKMIYTCKVWLIPKQDFFMKDS